MRKLLLLSILAAACLSSCEIKVKTGKLDSDSKIRNGIVLKSNKLEVEQAFLLYEDGTLVGPDNKASVNQKVILRLIVSGWKEKDGKVFLTGGEKVETSEGDLVLDEKNLFEGYKDGLSPADAKYISINVVITNVNKLYDYYKVNFFLRDDVAGDGFVEGHYKLYIK